jgi:uncharacterized SAM-binding protein YcdF (DUF218 family)
MLATRSIEALFSPLGILTLLLASGVVASIFRLRLGRRLLVCGALLFLIFLFSPLSRYLVLGLERQFPPMLVPPEVGRIVVLAGYAEEHPGYPATSNVSSRTIAAIAEGLRLRRLVPGSKLILSGGAVRRGDKPVAAMMADFCREMGVSAPDLIVEGSSQNTYENLCEVRKLVGTGPFILVAQACDLRRAVAVARKLNMSPIPAPACFWALPEKRNRQILESAYLENLSRFQWAYHEYVGYLWYRLLGRI